MKRKYIGLVPLFLLCGVLLLMFGVRNPLSVGTFVALCVGFLFFTYGLSLLYIIGNGRSMRFNELREGVVYQVVFNKREHLVVIDPNGEPLLVKKPGEEKGVSRVPVKFMVDRSGEVVAVK